MTRQIENRESALSVRTKLNTLLTNSTAFIGDYDSLSNAFAAGVQLDGGGQTYTLTEPMTFAAGTGLVNARLEVGSFITGGNEACLTSIGGGLGTPATVSANIIKGVRTATVSSTAGFLAGDTVKVSSTAWWSSSDSVPLSEEVKIESVDSATALTFDRPIRFAYATSDTAIIEKVTRVDVGYWDSVLMVGNGDQATGIDFQYTRGLKTGFMKFSGIKSRNLTLTASSGFDLGVTEASGSGESSLNYGVLYRDGSRDGTTGIVRGTDMRHVVTGGGTGGVNMRVHSAITHGVRPLAAVYDQHAGCLECSAGIVTHDGAEFEAGEDGIVIQGANARVDHARIDMDGKGRHSLNMQCLTDYAGEKWSQEVTGSFLNAVNTGAFIRPQGAANMGLLRLKATIKGCADEAIEAYLLDASCDFLDLDVDIDITGSASKQNIIARQYTTHRFAAGRIVGRSKRANDDQENIQLQGLSGNEIGNFTIAAVLENGSHGVRGVDAATGTINTAGNVYIGMATNEEGL